VFFPAAQLSELPAKQLHGDNAPPPFDPAVVIPNDCLLLWNAQSKFGRTIFFQIPVEARAAYSENLRRAQSK
jgi:hypothetical protein